MELFPIDRSRRPRLILPDPDMSPQRQERAIARLAQDPRDFSGALNIILAVIGVVLGMVALAPFSAGALERWLYGVSSRDPSIWRLFVGVLLLVISYVIADRRPWTGISGTSAGNSYPAIRNLLFRAASTIRVIEASRTWKANKLGHRNDLDLDEHFVAIKTACIRHAVLTREINQVPSKAVAAGLRDQLSGHLADIEARVESLETYRDRLVKVDRLERRFEAAQKSIRLGEQISDRINDLAAISAGDQMHARHLRHLEKDLVARRSALKEAQARLEADHAALMGR